MDSITTTATFMTTATNAATGATTTSTAPNMASSTGTSGAGMNCQISMLWNWNTVGACFITSQWQIASQGAMVGSCFGVIFLVMVLEMMRRGSKEFDRWIVRKHKAKAAAGQASQKNLAANQGNPNTTASSSAPLPENIVLNQGFPSKPASSCAAGDEPVALESTPPPIRPTVEQQALRALIHVAQFALAYFIMLLAMYYNGFILISIMIGAYLGAFLFSWQTLAVGQSPSSVTEEATLCCG